MNYVCPECGRQLHSVAENGEYRGLYKCFVEATYWRETDDGLVIDNPGVENNDR